VNVASHDHGENNGHGRGRNNGRGRGRGRGHGRGNNYKFSHQKWKNNGKYEKSKGAQSGNQGVQSTKNICYRCGSQGYWSRVCRTQKHLFDLYQESLKNKGKGIESNVAGIDDDIDDDQMDVTHLDGADFYAHPEGKIDYLIGDRTVKK
jgi:hypothetical protein